MKHFIYLISCFTLIYSDITYGRRYGLYNSSGIYFPTVSLETYENSVFSIMYKGTSISLAIFNKISSTFNLKYIDITMIISQYSHPKQRSAYGNSLSGQDIYILFDNNKIVKYRSSFTVTMPIITVSTG